MGVYIPCSHITKVKKETAAQTNEVAYRAEQDLLDITTLLTVPTGV
jgi:hypothetical protein